MLLDRLASTIRQAGGTAHVATLDVRASNTLAGCLVHPSMLA
jgi:hypothetical protein